MAYSSVGTDGGCGELDLFFVAARLGVDLFLEAAQGGEGRGHLGGHPAAPEAQISKIENGRQTLGTIVAVGDSVIGIERYLDTPEADHINPRNTAFGIDSLRVMGNRKTWDQQN